MFPSFKILFLIFQEFGLDFKQFFIADYKQVCQSLENDNETSNYRNKDAYTMFTNVNKSFVHISKFLWGYFQYIQIKIAFRAFRDRAFKRGFFGKKIQKKMQKEWQENFQNLLT